MPSRPPDPESLAVIRTILCTDVKTKTTMNIHVVVSDEVITAICNWMIDKGLTRVDCMDGLICFFAPQAPAEKPKRKPRKKKEAANVH